MKKLNTRLRFGTYTEDRFGSNNDPRLAVAIGNDWWYITDIRTGSIRLKRIKKQEDQIFTAIGSLDPTQGYVDHDGQVYNRTMLSLPDIANELTRHTGLLADPLYITRPEHSKEEYKDLQITKHFRRENKRKLKHEHR